MSRRVSPNASTLRRYFGRALLVAIVLATSVTPALARSNAATDSGPDSSLVELTAQAIERITEVSGAPPFQTTRIYDRHGNLIYELADRGRRDIVPLQTVPDIVVQATVATEDKNFYKHTGVDWTAVARAAWQNWQAEEIVSGASTITQQLVRALLLDETERYDLSLGRKYREAVLAIEIEDAYSKDEILEMYLDSIFYGHRSYGIVAAARTYFDKELDELSLAEAALLAGLPQSPNVLDPFVNPEAARERQLVVLELMERAKYITRAERNAAAREPIRLVPPEYPEIRAPHFVDYVRELLLERYGPEGIRQGLEVHTSVDLRYQALAETIAKAQIDEIGPKYNASNAAVVILYPPTGEILAMVGSVDYYDESIAGQVNITVKKRQPGSSIKPVVYATAFDRGWSPASVVWDVPTQFSNGRGGVYVPHNITGKFYGATRLRMALSNSMNVSAVKLLNEVGIDQVLDTAHALGIRSWNRPAEEYGLSLAVGGYEVTLLELTHAFATLANSGEYVPERAIREIRDGTGQIVFQIPEDAPPQYAVSPAAAYQVADVLSDTRSRQMVFGRNAPMNTTRKAAAKTGTTDGWRDNLTVGFTPYLTVGVWVGNSDGAPMRNALGSSTAAPIWHDIMEAIWANPRLYDSIGYADAPLPDGFEAPPSIYKTPVCELRESKFNRNCPRAYEDVLVDDERFGIVSVPDPDARPLDEIVGYCLPILAGEAPYSIERQAAFIPMPENTRDKAAARSWARRHGVALSTMSECDDIPTTRPVAQQPEYPERRQLVEIPEPVPQIAAEEAHGRLLPGTRAVALRQVGSIRMYLEPGGKGGVVGETAAGETLAIRKGPEMVKNIPWFEVRNLDRGIIGWVSGIYLRPEEVDIAEGGDPDALQIGGQARMIPGIDGLYIRTKASPKAPIVGVVRPRDIIILQQGPEKVKRSLWYEVVIESRGIAGWVDGRFLIPRYY